MSDFDWNDSESVVIKPVSAIAVYTNPAGELVIRQQDRDREEDQFVIIPLDRANDLIAAIQGEIVEE